jgi:hypothetical protein
MSNDQYLGQLERIVRLIGEVHDRVFGLLETARAGFDGELPSWWGTNAGEDTQDDLRNVASTAVALREAVTTIGRNIRELEGHPVS